MKAWSKNIVDWTEGNTAFVSVVFTWQLPQAYSRCVWYRQQGYHVRAGGTAVQLMPDYLKPVAEIGGSVAALCKHNRDATRTTLGCPNKCSFCGVFLIEPEYEELPAYEIKPIICDNNLTAASRTHWNNFVYNFKPLKGIDINQGLDARLFKSWHLDGLKELSLHKLRFAWDDVNQEGRIMDTLKMIIASGFPKSKIHVYILFNHGDTPQDALYRCETLWNMGIVPNVQRFQPLDCLTKNTYVDPNWNDQLLRDFTLYWSRRHLPLQTYRVRRLEKVMGDIRFPKVST